jgi:hypothetical protein
MTSEKKGSIGSAIVWIFIISVLFFWLPVIGPLIAGIVGGKKAGGIRPAIIAVFLPGIFFAIILFLLASSLTGIPLLGAIAGAGNFITFSRPYWAPLDRSHNWRSHCVQVRHDLETR